MFDVSKVVTPSGVVVLGLRGSLDADTVHDLESALEEASEAGEEKLILDLSELEYISSAGVGTFIGCVGALREEHRRMIFVGPSPDILELFEMLGFTKLFQIMANREEALEILAAS